MIVGVDCTFQMDGTIRVRRVYLEGSWKSVGQGRQWMDETGRHVLIMFEDEQVREIHLRPETMTWELKASGRDNQVLV